MGPSKIEFLGNPCGEHGAYVFFKSLQYDDIVTDKQKTLTLGQFFFLKISDDFPFCIGEIQLLWEDRNAKERLSSSRLYFLPEDTPNGRQSRDGQDELLAVSKKIVLKVEDLVTRIRSDVKWPHGTKPGANNAKYRKNGEISPVSKQEDSLCEASVDSMPVKIISYPQYCRYKAMLTRLEGVYEKYRDNPIVSALIGMILPNDGTRLMFCRNFFRYPQLAECKLVCDHLAPNLRGRPKKKKTNSGKAVEDDDSSDSSSTTSTTSSNRSRRALQMLQKVSSDSDKHRPKRSVRPTIPGLQVPPKNNGIPAKRGRPVGSTKRKRLESELLHLSARSLSLAEVQVEKKHELSKFKSPVPSDHPQKISDDTVLPKAADDGEQKLQEKPPKPEPTQLEQKPVLPSQLSDRAVRKAALADVLKFIQSDASPEEIKFYQELCTVMQEKRMPIERVPSLGFKQLDLYYFYTCTQKLGGYYKVTEQKLWKQIYDKMGGHPTNTSAAASTRRQYERLLLPYELHKRTEAELAMAQKSAASRHDEQSFASDKARLKQRELVERLKLKERGQQWNELRFAREKAKEKLLSPKAQQQVGAVSSHVLKPQPVSFAENKPFGLQRPLTTHSVTGITATSAYYEPKSNLNQEHKGFLEQLSKNESEGRHFTPLELGEVRPSKLPPQYHPLSGFANGIGTMSPFLSRSPLTASHVAGFSHLQATPVNKDIPPAHSNKRVNRLVDQFIDLEPTEASPACDEPQDLSIKTSAQNTSVEFAHKRKSEECSGTKPKIARTGSRISNIADSLLSSKLKREMSSSTGSLSSDYSAPSNSYSSSVSSNHSLAAPGISPTAALQDSYLKQFPAVGQPGVVSSIFPQPLYANPFAYQYVLAQQHAAQLRLFTPEQSHRLPAPSPLPGMMALPATIQPTQNPRLFPFMFSKD